MSAAGISYHFLNSQALVYIIGQSITRNRHRWESTTKPHDDPLLERKPTLAPNKSFTPHTSHPQNHRIPTPPTQIIAQNYTIYNYSLASTHSSIRKTPAFNRTSSGSRREGRRGRKTINNSARPENKNFPKQRIYDEKTEKKKQGRVQSMCICSTCALGDGASETARANEGRSAAAGARAAAPLPPTTEGERAPSRRGGGRGERPSGRQLRPSPPTAGGAPKPAASGAKRLRGSSMQWRCLIPRHGGIGRLTWIVFRMSE